MIIDKPRCPNCNKRMGDAIEGDDFISRYTCPRCGLKFSLGTRVDKPKELVYKIE